MYEVRLKPGHPTGTYHRGGEAFTKEPILLEEVSDVIARDPWLLVSEVREVGRKKKAARDAE